MLKNIYKPAGIRNIIDTSVVTVARILIGVIRIGRTHRDWAVERFTNAAGCPFCSIALSRQRVKN